MSDTVIRVENLSKSYTIRHQQSERYTALRDVVSNGVKGMGNRLLGRNHASLITGRILGAQ
jgi:lipopolysaccharide transport system ATP-binding protein